MKTKTLLTYGAIAVGAYLAYRYFMKPKAAAATDAAAASFTGNENAQFYQKFTGNEDAYNPFTGTIAVDRTGANPAAVKKAVRANLLRRKGF